MAALAADAPPRRMKRSSLADIPPDEAPPPRPGSLVSGGRKEVERETETGRRTRKGKKKEKEGGERGKKRTRTEEGGGVTVLATQTAVPMATAQAVEDGENSITEKKKKKRKLAEEGGMVTVVTTQTDSVTMATAQDVEGGENSITGKKKKKKRKLAEEGGSGTVVTTETGLVPMTTAQAVEDGENSLTGKKKKKKRKRDEDGGSVTVVTTQTDSVPMTTAQAVEDGENSLTGKKKKKKKRKLDKEGGSVTVVTTETDSVPMATTPAVEDGENSVIKKKKKKGKLVEEGGTVTLVTTQTDSLEPDISVSMATTQSRQRKKKKKVEEEEEWSVLQTETFNKDRVMAAEDALEELKRYVPDVQTRAADIISHMLLYDLKRFRKFNSNGIALRTGRCSGEENQKIHQNVENFLSLTGISSAGHLFYPQRYPQEAAQIKKLRVQHRFLEKIAEGIPRTCHKVYIRAKKMFDKLNYLGRFSEEENHALKKLQTLHGNDWKTISLSMDRSIYSIQKRFSMLATKGGPWEDEELERLMASLKVHMEKLAKKNQQENPGAGGLWVTRDQLCKTLPWKAISEQVQTRFSCLKTKLSRGRRSLFSGGPRTVQAKIDLINSLYSLDVEDVVDIDWDTVALAVGNVSPYDVQKMFHRLKVSMVPRWSHLSFCDIMDYLKEKVVPRLMLRLLETNHGDVQEEVQEEEVQERFLLSDMFSLNEVYQELDNTD